MSSKGGKRKEENKSSWQEAREVAKEEVVMGGGCSENRMVGDLASSPKLSMWPVQIYGGVHVTQLHQTACGISFLDKPLP